MGAEKTLNDIALEAEILRRRIAELESLEAERQKTGKTLQDQLTFLQQLIDTIPSPIFYKDTQGRYLGCNKAFEVRVGRTRDEIVGLTAADLYPAELAKKYDEMDRALFLSPGEQTFEASIVYADGEEHQIVLNKGTYFNADGEVAGLVGVTTDITRRICVENELRQTQD